MIPPQELWQSKNDKTSAELATDRIWTKISLAPVHFFFTQATKAPVKDTFRETWINRIEPAFYKGPPSNSSLILIHIFQQSQFASLASKKQTPRLFVSHGDEKISSLKS